MNRLFLRAAGVLSSLSLLTAPVTVSSQTVGVNAAIRNNVKVKADSTAVETNAFVKQKVALKNEVRTAINSTLQVLLLDRSSLTVGPNARFTVDKFVYDPNKKASAVGASFAKGTFRFLSGKSTRANPGQTSLRTPISSIGIRGTMVEGAVGQDALDIMQQQPGFTWPERVDPLTATLVVLRGPGKNARNGEKPGVIDVTANGQTVTVSTQGQAVFIPAPGAAPIGPFPLSVGAYSMFDVVLRTTPSRFLAEPGNTPPAAASAQSASNTSGTTSGDAASSAQTATRVAAASNSGISGAMIAGLIGLAAIVGGIAADGGGDDEPASP